VLGAVPVTPGRPWKRSASNAASNAA